MKMTKKNWYRRFLVATKGIFWRNPVLGMGLAVPFAVVAATSLQTAVGLSVGALMVMVPVGLLMPLILTKIPEQFHWLDYPLCALLAAVFVLPTRLIVGGISPALMDSVGVYFSLFCVSTLLFGTRDATAQEKDLAKVLLDLIRMWIGTALVFILIGSCREVLGNGTLWNKPLTWMKIRFSGMMVSGLGFILLGFLAALSKKLHRVILVIQLWFFRNGGSIKEKFSHMLEKEPKEKPEEAKTEEEESAEKIVEQITEQVMGKEQEK